MKKNTKGITLIALVITIIVLFILAGITIATLAGENGLLSRATGARDLTKRGELIDRVKLDILNDKAGNQGNTPNLSTILGKYFTNVPADLTDMTAELTAKAEYGGYTVTLGELLGQAVAGGGVDDMPTVTTPPTTVVDKNTKYDDGTDIAVIPKGFRVSSDPNEQKVETGLVVYDGNDNEWVWIPVPDASVMYTKVDEGIAITGGPDLSVVNGVATNYYSKGGIIKDKDNNDIARGLPNVTTSNYREPDLVVGSAGTGYDAANYSIEEFTSLKNMAQSLVDDYEEMIKSVADNHGFYIGRYELTGSVASPAEKTGAPLTNQNWYNLYKACKNIKTDPSITGVVEPRMIWGCQWDMVCSFIANHGDKKNIGNSEGWGNYKTTDVKSSDGNTIIKANGSSTILETGQTTFTMANRIYDIAGNCWEWTQEAFSNTIRVGRGGNRSSNGSAAPATSRGNTGPTEGYVYFSSRPTLYIK